MSEGFEQRIVSLRTRLFSICYGEDDATRLMAERLVERDKLLSAVTVEGKDPTQVQRERLYWNLVDTLDEATQSREQIEKQIKSQAALTRQFERELVIPRDASERILSHIEKCNAQIATYEQMLPEATALESELTAAISKLEKEHEKPEPRLLDGIMPPAPRTRSLEVDLEEFDRRIDQGLRQLYEIIFGPAKAHVILSQPERERVDVFKEEVDLRAMASSWRALQDHLIGCRDVAVKLITVKNRLTMIHSHVKSIVEDIPSDTDDQEMKAKSIKGRQLLERLEPIQVKAHRAVEEMKEAIRILETIRNETMRRSAGMT